MASMSKKWAWLVILTIAIFGIVFSLWIAKQSDRQLREDLLLNVQIIADTVNQHDVKSLSFTLSDRTNPAFVRLEDSMKKLAHVMGCRSLYSMIKSGNDIVFGPENLQEKDPFASPPGTIYKTPPEKLRSVFQNRKAITVGPYTDEYGAFVSAFAPVISPDTGEVVLVIGMDVEAADWKWNIASDAALPMTLTIFLVLLMMFFIHLQNTHMLLKAREASLHDSEKKYRFLFESMAQGIVYQASDGRIIDANPAAERILGLTLDQMQGKTSLDSSWEAIHEDGSPYLGETHPAIVALQTGKPLLHSVMGVVNPHDKKYRWIDIDAIPQFQPGDDKPYQVYSIFEDISERRQAEEVLRERTAKMDSIFRAAPTGIGVVSNRILVEVNQRICEMTGYSREELVGKSARILYPTQEDFDFVGQEKYRQIQSQGTGSVETKWRRKNGTIIDIILSSTPIDTGDLSAGVTFTALDITERKQAEEALYLFKNLVVNSSDAIGMSTPEGRHYYQNEAFDRMFGDIGDFPPETVYVDKAIGKQVFETIMGGGSWQGEVKMFKNDTTILDIFLRSYAIQNQDGRIIGLVGLHTDITERKKADEESRKLASIVRYSRELVNLATPNGMMVFLNDAGKKMLGISEEDIAQINIMQVIPEHLQDKVQQEVLPSIDEYGFWEGDLQYLNLKTGGLTDVHAITYKITDPDTGVMQFLANISLDITERKQAEEQSKTIETQLAHAQKMESIGTLAGGIAHDFNNILSAIIGYSELAMEDVSDPQKAKREIKEVLKAADRAKELAKHILTFSRKADVEYSPIALRTVVKDSIKMLRAIIPTTIDIQQDLTDSGLIMSNPTQINQILMNLCTNSSHAMDKTGGVLKISLKRMNINKDTEARELNLRFGPYLMLSVSDTGHGIPSEILDRIFEPYFTTKEMDRGTGLGLSVVHGIVISHGGNIICKSAPGKGTSFDIFLPEIESMKEVVTHTEEEPLPTGKEHILFVDDESVLVNLAQKMLSKLGYTIETSINGDEALKLFQDSPDKYDLIITDMTMPGMTGDRLAQKFMEIRQDIPIILCSGYSEHISKEKAKKIGIREFVMKPLEMKALAKTIRKVLAEKN